MPIFTFDKTLQGYKAEVVEDTICGQSRVTTLKVRYPRMIHAEFLRHRVFSRGAGSSRAVPVTRMAKRADASPVSWGSNQAGMQAGEDLSGLSLLLVQLLWWLAMHTARLFSRMIAKAGAHKQIANRLTEPFQWMEEVITGTDWDNFFNLRDHDKAQPEIQVIARLIKQAMDESLPRRVGRDPSDVNNWHLPFITPSEREAARKGRYDSRGQYYNCLLLAKLSSARCARVSYFNHDGTRPNVTKDLGLFSSLTKDPKALHASPMEHPCHPLSHARRRMRNFRGWKQLRVIVEEGAAE